MKKYTLPIIINAIFAALIICQENDIIDVLPVNDQAKAAIKTFVATFISIYNVLVVKKAMAPKQDDIYKQ